MGTAHTPETGSGISGGRPAMEKIANAFGAKMPALVFHAS